MWKTKLWNYFKKVRHDDIIGLTGTFSLLSAYGINSHNLTNDKKLIDLMNVYGAGAVGYNCWCQRVYPPLILESAWLCIAVSSLVKNIENDSNKKN